MKSILFIPLITAAFFAAACIVLNACGMRLGLADPIAAGAIASVAGILGVLPIAVAKPKDPVGILQFALVGTVLHLGSAVVLAIAAMALHVVGERLNFVYWMLGGYWVSLLVLIWQLRHRLIASIDLRKEPATI